MRPKTVSTDDNVEPASADGPSDRQDQDAGGPWRTSNESRRLADDDVEYDGSGRIIFGPDSAYLRDQLRGTAQTKPFAASSGAIWGTISRAGSTTRL
jgi:hypothetical protein